MTRVCLTRHVPSSGFLAPSTGSSPSGLADTLGPLPLLGFHSRSSFEQEGRGALPHPLQPLVDGARQPRTLRNTRSESSADSKLLEPACPGSTAVVPEPLSPPSKHITPGPFRGLSPPTSPLALEPSASGRTMTRRAGTSGS
jgi:hypothetical protein